MPRRPSLISFCNIPRRVPLAGQEFAVSEFRFIDLATLDWFIEERAGSILNDFFGVTADTEEERQAALRTIHKKHRDGPPSIECAAGAKILNTQLGLTFFLHVALSRHQPGLTPEQCADLFQNALPGELDRIQWIAYGLDPLTMVERMIDPEGYDAAPAGTVSYTEIADSLSRDRSLSYEQVANMSPSQAGFMARKGKAAELGYVPQPGEDLRALARRKKALYYGPDSPEAQAFSGKESPPPPTTLG